MRRMKVLAPTLSRSTRQAIRMDFMRFRARALNHWRNHMPATERLHLGCGKRHVPGWLNVDVYGSELDLDLACGRLPFPDRSFSAVVSQQVIEHLWLDTELLLLLRELKRVCKEGAEVWLACPDMDKVCEAYCADRGKSLIDDRQQRWPAFQLDAPPQQIINVLFHQQGQHKNLFDFQLLQWALQRAGFASCTRHNEQDLLDRFPEFPVRGDDYTSLYVCARP
jgi:predicted SAM-dependent methyltransferase